MWEAISFAFELPLNSRYFSICFSCSFSVGFLWTLVSVLLFSVGFLLILVSASQIVALNSSVADVRKTAFLHW